MYRYDNGQLSLSDFQQPVGIHLKEDNRWVPASSQVEYGFSDEETAQMIQEHLYLQYFAATRAMTTPSRPLTCP